MLAHIDEDKLKKRVAEALRGLSPEAIEKYAKRMIDETDERLETNVDEWIDGKPLSDIYIGKYCIDTVMQIQGQKGFLTALEALNCYAANPALGECKIWRTIQ